MPLYRSLFQGGFVPAALRLYKGDSLIIYDK